MATYRHTQTATTILVTFGIVLVILLAISTVIHRLIFSSALLLILAWIFRSLTIKISDTELIWYFGSGWPRKSVPLSEIASVEPICTGFWNGWGIHCTGRGWLYNVSGYGAVAIKLRNGKQFCLGTDQPQELARRLMSRQ